MDTFSNEPDRRIPRRSELSWLVVVLLLLITTNARAGGVDVHHPSVNGREAQHRHPVPVKTPVTLCFKSDAYLYSGGAHQSVYVLFQMDNGGAWQRRTLWAVGHEPQAGDSCVAFAAPPTPGRYFVRYARVPIFDATPRDPENLVNPKDAGVRQVANHLTDLIELAVVNESGPPPPSAATTLLLNGAAPTYGGRLQRGASSSPAHLSWVTRPTTQGVLYRWRLYPDEPTWTAWSPQQYTDLYFINAGTHSFEVETLIQQTGKQPVQLPAATYQFSVEGGAFVAEMIPKAKSSDAQSSPRAQPALTDLGNLYRQSRALLVEVTKFSDPAFGPLPYAERDFSEIRAALAKIGFAVEKPLRDKVNKKELQARLSEFFRSAQKDERLVVYITSHGFQDPLVKSQSYIVTSDCIASDVSTCLAMSEIDQAMKAGDALGVRHATVFLDACAAGLGVIAKGNSYGDITVAQKPGGFMMTAGMAEQTAQMDPKLEMSTFTYFLKEGLGGSADYTKDGIVSLTELLVYTRYKVAQHTSGAQTPSMGRISGTGEMVFSVTRK